MSPTRVRDVGPVDAWSDLSRSMSGELAAFDPDTLASLPEPAQRWLARVLPAGTPLVDAVILTMTGRIRLGPRWFDFRADQLLRPSRGFVWRPVVGGRIIRFVGADSMVDGEAATEFRFHRMPVVRAGGTNVALSAIGRLAGETVLWLPQILAPQAGARWRHLDADRAIALFDVAGHPVEVEVTIAANGRLTAVRLDRWNSSAKPPRLQSFGGPVSAELSTYAGARIAGVGTGGWDWGTDDWPAGEFFRYRIEAWTPAP